MAKLKIKNIGPIKNGLTSDNEYFDFSGVTLFVGSQGTGKSTIAKIYSTLSWIEKALVRGDFKPSHLKQYNRFLKHFDYQNISNYFNEDSEIFYKGEAFEIIYKKSRLEIIEKKTYSNYKFPKIMYVPAERNFITTVDRPDLIKRLPLQLYTFLEEYDFAKESISETINLPIGRVKYEYRKQNKKSYIVGSDFKLDLLEASSGFQSFVPLFLVTRFLSNSIEETEQSNYKQSSIDEEKKIKREIDKIFGSSNFPDNVKRALLEKLSSRNRYASFLNIVEEPEQNLYPFSQKQMLFELLKFKNVRKKNGLILTTHSPYIINYLTLAIKANELVKKFANNKVALDKINQIVPVESVISSDVVNIYELKENGDVGILPSYNGLPSDENYLNYFLAESNDLFVNLLELEDLCQ